MIKSKKWLLVVLLSSLLASPLLAQENRMHVLAATGTAQEIQTALQNGANFNDCDWAGVTALMAAAGNNRNQDVIPILIKFGAAVDARDRNGETALMFASARNGDPSVITALLQGGADIE
jgi:ankyrin repeat protein